ncbi:MAG: DNA topoisomerase IB [Pseudotabrizicola sp.]|uniref:DNA topoisomerase IB n=1 Tax=Pseudotabrizicola sp. TaxID=2939647 RepID=UPI00271D4B49|nr:DNA topoisomerase IB [Pseudotabrizicola sp.]MDO9638419.1 DNA topoisomerase IB [Pseudotabrizicola sp.]
MHVTDDSPGILRRRAGKGYAYIGPDGKVLTGAERARVSALGIPPAYVDVWICPHPDGHLQATGRDARGRKQYLYHALWSHAQAETKFDQLPRFGEALPGLRRQILRDLRGDLGDKRFTIAALLLLLDRGYLRVGNAAYAAQNRSFGATTLLRRHLSLSDDAVHLRFRSKGGKRVQQTLRNKRLHRIMQQIEGLPGRNLFTYIDAAGKPCPVDSSDVNAYLADAAGEGLTAKTFRTWGGTLAAFETALALEPTQPLSIRLMAEAAGERLQNTPAISRKSYIHPKVLSLADLPAIKRVNLLEALDATNRADLRRNETRLLAFLSSQGGEGI